MNLKPLFKVISRAVLIVSVFVAVLSYTPITAKASGTKPNDFDSYLRSKNSPLAGQGSLLDTYGQKYNVDPRLVIAIAGQESNFGKNGDCATKYHNAWGYGGGWPSCLNLGSWENAIQNYVIPKLRQLREQSGAKTISSLVGNGRWCTSGCSSWVSGVSQFYREQGGDSNTNKLTYSYDLGTNGVDLWTYCKNKWGSSADRNQPVELYGSTAYNWYCRIYVSGTSGAIKRVDMNVNEACDWQYKSMYVTQSPSGTYTRPGIYARTDDWKNPYSWRCYYYQ